MSTSRRPHLLLATRDYIAAITLTDCDKSLPNGVNDPATIDYSIPGANREVLNTTVANAQDVS